MSSDLEMQDSGFFCESCWDLYRVNVPTQCRVYFLFLVLNVLSLSGSEWFVPFDVLECVVSAMWMFHGVVIRHLLNPSFVGSASGVCAVSQTRFAVTYSLMDMVCIMDIDGCVVRRIGGGRGSRSDQFFHPTGLCFDRVDLRLAVCDTHNSRVQIVGLDGVFQHFICSSFSNLYQPRVICDVAESRFVVCDHNSIQMISYGGVFLRCFRAPNFVIGMPHMYGLCVVDDYFFISCGLIERKIFVRKMSVEQFQTCGDFYPSVLHRVGSGLGEFDKPSGLSVLPDGSLIIADRNNHRLQVVDIDRETPRYFDGHTTGHFYPTSLCVLDNGYVVVIGGTEESYFIKIFA